MSVVLLIITFIGLVLVLFAEDSDTSFFGAGIALLVAGMVALGADLIEREVNPTPDRCVKVATSE